MNENISLYRASSGQTDFALGVEMSDSSLIPTQNKKSWGSCLLWCWQLMQQIPKDHCCSWVFFDNCCMTNRTFSSYGMVTSSPDTDNPSIICLYGETRNWNWNPSLYWVMHRIKIFEHWLVSFRLILGCLNEIWVNLGYFIVWCYTDCNKTPTLSLILLRLGCLWSWLPYLLDWALRHSLIFSVLDGAIIWGSHLFVLY